MNNRLNNIFSETECLSPEMLSAYADNKLNAEERYLVEKHLTDCELCSDAVEGMLLVKDKSGLNKIYNQINNEIDKRIHKKERKVFHFDFRMRLAAAALIIMVLGVSFIFKYYFGEQKKDTLAQRLVKESEITKQEKKVAEKNIEKAEGKKENAQDFAGSKEQSIVVKDEEKEKVIQKEEANDIPDMLPISDKSGNLNGDIQEQPSTSYFRAISNNREDSSLHLEKNEKDKSPEGVISGEYGFKESNEKTIVDSISTIAPGRTITTLSQTTTENDLSKAEEKPKQKANKKSEYRKENSPVTSKVTVLGSTGGLEDKRYSAAVKKYHENDYAGSKDILESYIADNPGDYNALYYCGVSYYFLNQFDSTLKYLNKVLEFKNGSFFQSAQWYVALAHLGKNENNKAKKILNDIIDANGSYKKQAEDKLLEIGK